MKSGRLLSALMLLQAHGRLSSRDLAERLEVSERTAHRDMEALSAAGVPVLALRGAHGGWELAKGWRTKVPGLDEAELRALLMAQPSALGDPSLAAAAERAFGKLMAALPGSLRGHAASIRARMHIDPTGWRPSSEDLSTLPIVQDAIERDVKLTFLYTRGDGETAPRTVEPFGVVCKQTVWYLVARAPAGMRTYRISRMSQAVALAMPSKRPADFNLAAYWKSSTAQLDQQRAPFTATLALAPQAVASLGGWLQRSPAASIPHAFQPPPTWVVLDVEFESLSHAQFVVLGFGPRSLVLAPEQLRERVIADLAETAALGSRISERPSAPPRDASLLPMAVESLSAEGVSSLGDFHVARRSGSGVEEQRSAGAAVAETSREMTREQLVEFYRLMYLSRRTDDREIVLKRQQKIFFQVSCAGHEALLVAAGMAMRPAYDWFFPYYRDRAICLALGNTVEEQLLQAVGSADDPASGGRQMPSHWSNKRLHIVTGSSATATQCLPAIGCAEAGRYFSRHPEAAAKHTGDYREFKDVTFHGDEVTYVSIGEGSTSQGEFWESLNTASNAKLPVVYVIEDNEYAISTPVEANTPGGNISRLIANFPNFHFAEIDGTDPIACYAAMVEAVEYCRAGNGPALVHGHVVRPYSHSLSDDERQYRSEQEVQADSARDPIAKMQMWLLREGILDADAINRLERQVDEEVQRAADRALAAALPSTRPEAILRHQYSEDLKPTDPRFDTTPAPNPDTAEKAVGDRTGTEKTMAELINHCLKDEMRRDPRIVVFGEDVADATRDEPLRAGKLKGKGGVFKLTAGLQTEFGSERVWNSPLAEANIVGRALGMAVRGLKPVVEIQFFDYIWPAMHQIRNELSLVRWRSNGEWSCPVVIRVPIGGYLTGGSIYHSQSGESIFTHIPGLRVVMPSNALDAAGLLRTAIRSDDPVLFLEHKRLYRETFGRAIYPGPEYAIPFGKAKIVRPGKDLTVITYGAIVPRALQAAEKLHREAGVDVEVIDLRTLSPYDWEAIAASVRKTSRVLVAHEDTKSWGYGAEIAARIGEELFDSLDAPVRRVAAMDTFVAYQPILEDAILPQSEDLYRAMADLAKY